MSRWRYLPHVLYSTALTSLSVHLLTRKRAAQDDRQRLAARTSILEGLVGRLRSGEHIPDAEIERMLRLGKTEDEDTIASREAQRTEIDTTWKTAIFGRRSGNGMKERQ